MNVSIIDLSERHGGTKEAAGWAPSTSGSSSSTPTLAIAAIGSKWISLRGGGGSTIAVLTHGLLDELVLGSTVFICAFHYQIKEALVGAMWSTGSEAGPRSREHVS